MYGPADGLLYLCVQAFTPASLDLFTTQAYSHGRLSIYEDVLTTFQLDSQDGVYFRFTS